MTYLTVGEWRDLNNNKIKTSTQIVTTQKTDTWYSNATTFTDIPGMSVTITPRFATSKVFIIIKLSITTYGHMHVRLMRNGVSIGQGDVRGSRTSSHFAEYGTNSYNTTGWEPRLKGSYWLDSPASTAALTYNLQYANVWSSSYYSSVNYNGYSDDDNTYNYNTSSSITVMEIMQ